MKCKICGKKIADNCTYCPECGAKTFGDSLDAEKANSFVDSVVREEVRQRKRTRTVAIAIAISTTIAVAGFTFGVYKGMTNVKSQGASSGRMKSEDTMNPGQNIENAKRSIDKAQKAAEEVIEDPLKDYPDVIYSGSNGRDDLMTKILTQRFLDENDSGIGPDSIMSVCCDDFDNNGVCEEFIFAGSMPEEPEEEGGYIEGSGWYVGLDYIQQLDLSQTEMWLDTGCFYDFGDRKFFVLNERYVTGANSYIWTVDDGRPVKDGMSEAGYFYQDENGRYAVVCSIYDMTYDKEIDQFIGHTWKPYYLYFDAEKDALVEYAGNEIDPDRLKEYCDEDVLGELESVNAYVLNAYIRENGLLNINYIIPGEYDITFDNATYDTAEKEFVKGFGSTVLNSPMGDSANGGTYIDKYTMGYASYPESEEIYNKKIILDVESGENIIVLDGIVIVCGNVTNEIGNAVGKMAFVVDMDTEFAPGYEQEELSATELIASYVEDESAETVSGHKGIFYITATGCHVDLLGSRYWE